MGEAEKPIGVFDSGVGGLTVLESMAAMLPGEDFIYVADQGHCPYGTKTAEQIGDRVEKVTRYLVSCGVKAIVIACNTASVRIDRARAVTDIPVISVIQPTCARAVEVTRNKKVAVLGTVSTIKSGTYQKILQGSGVTCVPLACSEFVEYIERGGSEEEGERLVRDKLGAIKDAGMDTLVHGCTHFSLLEKHMRKVLGDINYVACGRPAGEELKKILARSGALNATGGRIRVLTTGSVEGAKRSMSWFGAAHEGVAHVDIE